MPCGAFNCQKWPKNGQKRPFLAISPCFFLLCCNHKFSNVAKCQLSSHLAIFTNMECSQMPYGAYDCKKWPKKGQKRCFGPFCLNTSSSTVTISLIVLQNVRYYHTEQCLQTWRDHTCLEGLIIAKNDPKMVKNGWFCPSRLDSSSSIVT